MPMGTQISGALSQATKWARGAKTTTTRGSTRTAGGAIFRPKTSLSTGTTFGGGLTRRAQFAAGGAAATTAAGGAMAVANGNKDLDVSKAFAEDYEIGKAETKSKGDPSAGRLVTGAVLAPYHGLVAGRKGKKLHAAGSQLAGTVGGYATGATLGALAGAAAKKPLLGAQLGASAGTVAGGGAGTVYANRKGYLKAEKKVSKSLGIPDCWLED